MAKQRQLHIEYPGATYHMMSRGNRRQDIFLDDVARHFGALRLEAAEARAGRLISQELGRRHWEESDPASWPKHDPGKVQIAPD